MKVLIFEKGELSPFRIFHNVKEVAINWVMNKIYIYKEDELRSDWSLSKWDYTIQEE